MLDVHPPHHPAHTWKDFFIHIATIVVGLLIAVGLEQGVEAIHHRHQAHRMEFLLREESRKNRDIIAADITIMQRTMAVAERNKAALEGAQTPDGAAPFVYEQYDPAPEWSAPTNSVYAAARDNGSLSLLPPSLVSYLARLEFGTATAAETGHQVFDEQYKVLALVRLHPDAAMVLTKIQGTLSRELNTEADWER
jgi:hypothetical protein